VRYCRNRFHASTCSQIFGGPICFHLVFLFFVERYGEAFKSGQKRPQHDKILAVARRRALDAIWVHALDRWGRSVQDMMFTMAEIEALGVAFIVPGHIDMTTPMGRMLTHFLGAFAEFERELIREQVRSGLANARTKKQRPRILKFELFKKRSLKQPRRQTQNVRHQI
jgi:DNA invertase Pin-like site-specific DNA recombinase